MSYYDGFRWREGPEPKCKTCKREMYFSQTSGTYCCKNDQCKSSYMYRGEKSKISVPQGGSRPASGYATDSSFAAARKRRVKDGGKQG